MAAPRVCKDRATIHLRVPLSKAPCKASCKHRYSAKSRKQRRLRWHVLCFRCVHAGRAALRATPCVELPPTLWTGTLDYRMQGTAYGEALLPNAESSMLKCKVTRRHRKTMPARKLLFVSSLLPDFCHSYMKSNGTLLEHSWNTPFSLVLRCGNTPEHSWKIPEHSVFLVESAICCDLNIIILNGSM